MNQERNNEDNEGRDSFPSTHRVDWPLSVRVAILVVVVGPL